MGLTEIAVVGTGLAMDAVAVSMTNGMCCPDLTKKDYAAMILFFGAFQGIMPLLGFYTGSVFAEWITRYSGIVIFLILGVIGGNMIRESVRKDGRTVSLQKRLTLTVLFFQAVATSIDAFAVGVGFCAADADIVAAAGLIALITAMMVFFAVLIGKKFGDFLGNGAEFLGGAVLMITGLKGLL